ncbi:sporulation transcriptional regulator SpoIIID [Proteinivorax hydrogeniformans]|uniref:Sporulation transcriptional regulator SpoIIID n=1 Tax=Proteinivorax hydrogeniformans TaxID=1826727 RepID=A0AAU8HTD6_9FIRM
MNDYIVERVLEISEHVIKTESTVRKVSEMFGVSKSTVHKDLTERLPNINKELAEKVKTILEKNKKERHIRGGIATKNKYLQPKN